MSEDHPSGIALDRFTPGKHDECEVCGHLAEKMLCIYFATTIVVLCPVCEGVTLQALLSNYVRRMRRGKKTGYIGNLIKEKPTEEGDVIDVEATLYKDMGPCN